MLTIAELLDRWDAPDGHPYTGILIDPTRADNDGPLDPGCMCAQGQALHYIGGWEPQRLRKVKQAEADAATAELLGISRAHAVLLRNVNDNADGAPSVVLRDPGKALGDQWSKLLDFWWALDGLSPAQWGAAWGAARDAARDAAGDAAGDAARDAAWDAAWDAAGDAAWASSEIQGAAIMRERGQSFYFLPLFGFASPDDIPARPADYGKGIVPAA